MTTTTNGRETGQPKTETISQGDYKLTNPVGTNKDRIAMSDSKARVLLSGKAKYTTKSAQIELLEAPDSWWVDDVWVTRQRRCV